MGSRLMPTKLFKVIFASHQKQLLARHHFSQERIAALESIAPLARGEHFRIDVPSELLLCWMQCVHHLTESHRANDHQIDVASLRFGTARYRAENERAIDSVGQRLKRLGDHVRQSGSL